MLNFILLVHVFHARTFYSLSTTARGPVVREFNLVERAKSSACLLVSVINDKKSMV